MARFPETSLATFNKIRNSPYISRMQFFVAETLWAWQNESAMRKDYPGGMSQSEVLAWCQVRQDEKINGIWKRFKELVDRNTIRVSTKRPCNVSGQTVYIFRLTGKVPVAPPKYELTALKALQQLIEEVDEIREGQANGVVWVNLLKALERARKREKKED